MEIKQTWCTRTLTAFLFVDDCFLGACVLVVLTAAELVDYLPVRRCVVWLVDLILGDCIVHIPKHLLYVVSGHGLFGRRTQASFHSL